MSTGIVTQVSTFVMQPAGSPSATGFCGGRMPMVTEPGEATRDGTPPLAQSRSVIPDRVTRPLPLTASLARWRVKSVPLDAVAPQGSPRMTQSTL